MVVADPPPSVAHVFSRKKKIKRRERNHWLFDVVGKGLYLSSRNVDPSTKLIDSSGGSLYALPKQRR
jgi:hypothetical protein